MASVIKRGSSVGQLWRRLWAVLALACALSLAGGSIAGAAEIGTDLQTLAAAVSDDSRVVDHGQPGEKTSPTKSHCALCCAHGCSSVLPMSVAAVSPRSASDVPQRAIEVFARFERADGHDQPPRA